MSRKKWLVIGLTLLVGLPLIALFVWPRKVHAPLFWFTQKKPSKAVNTPKEVQSQKTEVPAPFNKSQYSIDDPNSIWVVSNKKRPLNPKTYIPADLVVVGNGQYMRTEAADAYARMVADAKTAGYSLSPVSAYRSYNTQVSVYGNEVNTNGQAVADTQSARPGHSEHQTGLAIDLGTGGCIEDCFGTTAASKWVFANAAKYGFVQRYLEGKADITGYRHEPWHYRYVGADLAAQLTPSGQTLEEFFGLPAAPSY